MYTVSPLIYDSSREHICIGFMLENTTRVSKTILHRPIVRFQDQITARMASILTQFT